MSKERNKAVKTPEKAPDVPDKAPPPPRARKAPARDKRRGPWGAVPQGVTEFRLAQLVGDTNKVAGYVKVKGPGGITVDTFPIAALSIEAVQERGPGRYQCFWFRSGERGQRVSAGKSSIVDIEAQTPEREAAPADPAAAAAAREAQAFEAGRQAERHALQEQISWRDQMRGDVMTATIEQMRSGFQQAIELAKQAREPTTPAVDLEKERHIMRLEHQLEKLEETIEDIQNDDEDITERAGQVVAGAVAAGGSIWDQLGAALLPEIIKNGPALIQALAKKYGGAPAQQPAPAPPAPEPAPSSPRASARPSPNAEPDPWAAWRRPDARKHAAAPEQAQDFDGLDSDEDEDDPGETEAAE